MQLTDWENANNIRNEVCADTQTAIEWPYTVHSPYCGSDTTTFKGKRQ